MVFLLVDRYLHFSLTSLRGTILRVDEHFIWYPRYGTSEKYFQFNDTLAQTICIHWSSLSDWHELIFFRVWKQNRSKIWTWKSREQKTGSCLFTLLFSNLGPSGSQTDPCFQNKDSGTTGCKLTGQLYLRPHKKRQWALHVYTEWRFVLV